MSYNRMNIGSGSRNVGRNTYEFGRTYVVRPRGTHQATIVWLHGIGEMGSSWTQFLESLPLPNVKWICPSAPTRPVALFGGLPCTAWFNVEDMSEDASDDVEGLDASAMHIANMLSNEPDDIKLGVAGFSMGAAMALYSATCRVIGQYGNGNRYPINLSVAVALSGWLPCSRFRLMLFAGLPSKYMVNHITILSSKRILGSLGAEYKRHKRLQDAQHYCRF